MDVNEKTYKEDFDAPGLEGKPKYVAALEHARENRQFEIELYWKRATYFWGLITATFAGYFAVLVSSVAPAERNLLAFILACIGIVLTFAWFMVDKGSKQWQANWEAHVDMLEDEVTGPLYKTVLRNRGGNFFKNLVTGPASMSVSRINQIVNLFILAIWVLLSLHAAWPIGWMKNLPMETTVSNKYAIFTVLAALFIVLIVWLGRTDGGDQVHKATKRTSGIA